MKTIVQRMKIYAACCLVFGATASLAQQVGGSVTSTVSIRDSEIITLDVNARDLSGGGAGGVHVQTIELRDTARVSGDVFLTGEISDSTLLLGPNSSVQSIKLGSSK